MLSRAHRSGVLQTLQVAMKGLRYLDKLRPYSRFETAHDSRATKAWMYATNLQPWRRPAGMSQLGVNIFPCYRTDCLHQCTLVRVSLCYIASVFSSRALPASPTKTSKLVGKFSLSCVCSIAPESLRCAGLQSVRSA